MQLTEERQELAVELEVLDHLLRDHHVERLGWPGERAAAEVHVVLRAAHIHVEPARDAPAAASEVQARGRRNNGPPLVQQARPQPQRGTGGPRGDRGSRPGGGGGGWRR